jgi:hypothetical protein
LNFVCSEFSFKFSEGVEVLLKWFKDDHLELRKSIFFERC